MIYEEAIRHDTYVTYNEVMRELENHGVIGEDFERFFDEVKPTGGYVGRHHLYKSREVLEWLGY